MNNKQAHFDLALAKEMQQSKGKGAIDKALNVTASSHGLFSTLIYNLLAPMGSYRGFSGVTSVGFGAHGIYGRDE